MHRDNAILALRAGKPVLIEKPFAMNAKEAAEVVAVARELKLFAMEAMWTRFLPHIAKVRNWVADGALGEIVTVIADHGQWLRRIRSSGCSRRHSAVARCWTSASTRCRSPR
jgi:predicted dehydrogenase